jgi:hypothetical protein
VRGPKIEPFASTAWLWWPFHTIFRAGYLVARVRAGTCTQTRHAGSCPEPALYQECASTRLPRSTLCLSGVLCMQLLLWRYWLIA